MPAAVQCKGCRTLIVWLRTAAGKAMPCEAPRTTAWIAPKAVALAVEPLGTLPRWSMLTDAGEVVAGWRVPPRTEGAREVSGHEPHWGRCAVAKTFKRQA